jgi:hypothetical protein
MPTPLFMLRLYVIDTYLASNAGILFKALRTLRYDWATASRFSNAMRISPLGHQGTDSMNDGDILLKYSQIFERYLRETRQATGNGLRELVGSGSLTPFIKREFDKIVPARNKYAHEGVAPPNGILKRCQRIAVEFEILDQIPKAILSPPAPSHHKQILRSFNPQFGDHPAYTTSFVDYWRFHEAKESWYHGRGTLLSATHMEIERLWSQVDLISVYEAFLVRFLSGGGEVTRIFALGGRELDEKVRRLLASVVFRHNRLGFKTLIASQVDLNRATCCLDVNCDMFAVTNNETAMFFSYPNNDYPLMVRTTEKSFVANATKAFSELRGHSIDADLWRRQQNFKLSTQEINKVEGDCGKIHEMARDWGNATC